MKPIHPLLASPADRSGSNTPKQSEDQNPASRESGNDEPGEGFNEKQNLQSSQSARQQSGKHSTGKERANDPSSDPTRSISHKNDPSLKGDDE